MTKVGRKNKPSFYEFLFIFLPNPKNIFSFQTKNQVGNGGYRVVPQEPPPKKKK